MRLWHQDLISKLPPHQLLGQHRECCALRGLGWGRKHSTVDYVFTFSVKKLFNYHQLVLREMKRRGYRPDLQWYSPEYRGKNAMPWPSFSREKQDEILNEYIYSEHDDAYLEECLTNLRKKGIEIFPRPSH